MLPIITISREYYAGGTTVAKGLSERLGIPWYEHDISKLAAKISGYSVEEIKEEGEEISKLDSIIDAMLNGLVSYKSSHDEIFKAQREAVLELAKEPCIIVGRCAGAMLKDENVKTFDIFLYADEEIRLKRAIDVKELSEQDARKHIEKRDAFRRAYYKKYTGHEYNDFHNYSLCIDTGLYSYDKVIDVAEAAIKGCMA